MLYGASPWLPWPLANRALFENLKLTPLYFQGLRSDLHEALPAPDVRARLDGQQRELREPGDAGWHPGRRHGTREVPHSHRSYPDQLSRRKASCQVSSIDVLGLSGTGFTGL